MEYLALVHLVLLSISYTWRQQTWPCFRCFRYFGGERRWCRGPEGPNWAQTETTAFIEKMLATTLVRREERLAFQANELAHSRATYNGVSHNGKERLVHLLWYSRWSSWSCCRRTHPCQTGQSWKRRRELASTFSPSADVPCWGVHFPVGHF